MFTTDNSALVSVVIPIYNGSKFIEECLTSLSLQDYKNIQIIVVDDGSTDDSIEVVRLFILRNLNLSIKLICQQNSGASAARNLGLKNSSGSYVAFLDADDYWFPRKVSSHLLIMKSKKIQALGSYMRYANSYSRKFGLCGEMAMSRQGEIKRGEFMPAVLSSFIFHRDVLLNILFDEQLRYSQDLDLLARIAQRTEICVISYPLGFYRLHANSISTLNGLEQELHYQFIKWRYSNQDLNSKVSFIDYRNLYQLILTKDRIAGLRFRNFGVLLINGKLVPAILELIKALRASPIFVINRFNLRARSWFRWRIGR